MHAPRLISTSARSTLRLGLPTALVAWLVTAAVARPTTSLDGVWSGHLQMGSGQSAGSVSGALEQSGRSVAGTLTIDAAAASGVFEVGGTVRGKHALIVGSIGLRRLRWKARFDRRSRSWRGPLVERGGGRRVHAMLVLARDADGGPTCGSDYFASDVMPRVMEPICAQCHVPGGLAQAAAFKVTPGNPTATARSAALQVDPIDPGHSKLVAKPRANLPHGGGTRILAGSPEEQTLLHWIALVTAPGCDLAGAGGGGGGGGGGTGADLYAEHCASCHGADARGLGGRPDIHCTRDVSNAVRTGRSGPAGDMPAFTDLSDASVAAIQGFLDGLCPVAGVTGAELYASNCAICHGTDATGSATAPTVRCATRVADAMHLGRGAAMPSFPAISDAEVALLDAFLTGLCDQSGRRADELYAGNCATCHGATATGGTNGLGVAGPDIHCSRGLATPLASGQGTEMPPFPRLAAADVAGLQQYLTATFCPADAASGADLYAGNCASCHGANGHGLDGRPDIRCNRAIHDVVLSGRTGPAGTMPAFAMTDAEIGRVQAHLTSLCPVGSAGGADLFASNCASCHGGDATGTAAAPGVRCATRVADALAQGRGQQMPPFPAMVASEVTAVQDWLDAQCTANGRPAAEVFAGNCATCHGPTATGGRNGLGVQGPDIHCSRRIATPVASGQGADMPAFPGLGAGDVGTLQAYVTASFCPVGTATGAEVYAGNCAACHGTDARGVDGQPNIRCNRAIHDVVVTGRTGPAGTMPAFALSDAEIALVQTHLDGLCPAGGATGADLFAGNCATCHGADALGTAIAPSVRCATRVADAVQQGRGTRMPSLPALAPVDVATLQAFLTAACTASGRHGADLYAANCSTCHGETATGGQNGLGADGPDIHCSRAIATPVTAGQATDMPAFPGLSPTDVATVQQYLTASFCPVGTASGAELYAGNCATCHGADAAGTGTAPGVRCATRVADALLEGRGMRMPAFPGVVALERTRIQSHLTGICNQLGRPGADLYEGNCVTCHGTTAAGGTNGLGVHGPEIQCTGAGDYVEKVRNGDEGMPAFPGLDPGDVAAIVTYVHTGFCQGG